MRPSSRNLILFCALSYLFVAAILFVTIRKHNDGHFIYALDDPYIHLALAENLAHGHYGINPTEFSSPSSSVLWPFLLIPLAGTAMHSYVPLFWNLLFGLLSACLIGWAVARWPPQRDEQGRMPFWQQMITALLLMLSANIASLTFVGMEHVLQILLSICCAIGIMEALSDREIPTWCLAATIIAPMVRYENLAITVAICFALAGTRQWKKAWTVLGLAVAPLIAFSGYLVSRGLPVLPMSVLVKGNVYISGGPLYKVFKQVRSDIFQCLVDPERFTISILFLIFVGLTWTATTRARRFTYAGVAVLGALQLAIGRFQWFFRYEVYALIFLLLICVRVLSDRPKFMFGYFALGLVFCASPFIRATELTVSASEEIYRQQFQMHRFVTEFYHGDYAVNDLGLVSYQRTPGTYVLDVFGLASVEASRQNPKTQEWLSGITKRHAISLAMLYPEWFQIPESWTPVAKMCVPSTPININEPCMVFYSTDPAATARIRADLARFEPTLPDDVTFYFDPERREGGYAMPRSQPN
ncbi:hypothetical protein [Granulicella arctica]|uniref:hypothetical protein n=1 Tax=Granulicella arctica TaxID=940613 RepID=UPI0021E00A09|nr:hypothetical protein [Granulicella arctica]